MSGDLSTLDSEQLAASFKSVGLPGGVVQKISAHGIAGRHLDMLMGLTTDSLAPYGLNLGDLFDIKMYLPKVLALQHKASGMKENIPPSVDRLKSHAAKENKPLFVPDPYEVEEDSPDLPSPSLSNDNMRKERPFSHDDNDEYIDDVEDFSLQLETSWDPQEPTSSGVSSSFTSEQICHNDSDESDIEDEELALLADYASQEAISRMSYYEKKAALRRIQNYRVLISKGVNADRPSFSSSSPEALKNCNVLIHGKGKKKKPADPDPDFVAEDQGPEEDGDQERSQQKPPDKKLKTKQASHSLLCTSASKVTLTPDLLPFLASKTLSKTERARIQTFLESPSNSRYSILEILRKEDNKEDEDAGRLASLLEEKGAVFGKDLKLLVQILTDHLYSQVTNPNLLTVEMRESMAVSVVASFPKMSQKPLQPEDQPWTWLFDRRINGGKFARVVARRQNKQKEKRPRGGGTGKRQNAQKKMKVLPPPPKMFILESELSKEAKYLKLLNASDNQKSNIVDYMDQTYVERRNLIDSGLYHLNAILTAFPHLKAFQGEMIDGDFNRRYPSKGRNLLLNFSEMVPKLLKLANSNPEKYPPQIYFQFRDDFLNALIILSKYLPLSKRTYDHEKPQSTVPDTNNLIQIVQVGADVRHEIKSKREKLKYPVQPYLLGVGDKRGSIPCMFLILGDGHCLELARNTQPLTAIDLLFKAHFVFNLHYSLGWKNVLRFLEMHLYKMTPKNPRLSVFMEQYMELVNII